MAVRVLLDQSTDAAGRVLTSEALAFAADIHRALAPKRDAALDARHRLQRALDAGAELDFDPTTREIRDSDWRVPPAPHDLRDRRVEITGPVERKMMINALNSGAKVFMADFEDANSPTWANVVDGQANLIDAVAGSIAFVSADGKRYSLSPQTATLVVRPRGWHLVERHVDVDGAPISASIFDFALYFYHNARALIEKGSGPYFYLPKLEAPGEAALWNDAFCLAEGTLGVPRGTIRATVLIETIGAAYAMDEILFALGPHATGLNAGRWDYIFSVIKKFHNRPDALLPDRSQVVMTVPFMRAYTELLVRTCHRRGAHAIGGMAAFIPNRRDPDVTERALVKVREDKVRESGDGFDGTWVAHPDLVPVAQDVFDAKLGERPNQLEVKSEPFVVDPASLRRFDVPGGTITDAGLHANVSVGVRYLQAWLSGTGAAAIDNLMEDVATAEISRAQVWQWVHRGRFTVADVNNILDAEFAGTEFARARALFETVALSGDFIEFLTLPGYELLP